MDMIINTTDLRASCRAMLINAKNGGGGNGSLRAVIDSGGGLTVVSGQTPAATEDNSNPDEQYTDYNYSYTSETYSSSIKTSTTVDGTTSTHTQSFSKLIITGLYSSAGTQLMYTDWNESTGKINGYYDAKNEQIYLEEWRDEYTELNSQLNANAAAIAWVLCKNEEQSSSFTNAMQSYRKGLVDGGNEAVEDVTVPLDDYIDISPGKDPDVPPYDGMANAFSKGGVYVKTDEITVTDNDGNPVTGVFQLRIAIENVSESTKIGSSYDITTQKLVLTLTGNGVSKSYEFKEAWAGSTSASSPSNTGSGNQFYMTSAKLNKNYGISGSYYWEYVDGYRARSYGFTGDFLKALQAGTYCSTMPFEDVN